MTPTMLAAAVVPRIGKIY